MSKKSVPKSKLRVVEPKIKDPAERAKAIRKAATRVRAKVGIDSKGRKSG